MRKFMLIGSMVLALLTTQFAQAETVSKTYEQSGDPFLVCPLNASRPSSRGVCIDVPAGSQNADIWFSDKSSVPTAFRYTFLNAAGLPAYVEPFSTAYGLLGYGIECGRAWAYVPSGAVTLRIELAEVNSPSPWCGPGTSGRVDVHFLAPPTF